MVSALSGAVLRMKLDKARKAQSVEKDKLIKANALVRVLTERLRTDEKKAARTKLAGGGGATLWQSEAGQKSVFQACAFHAVNGGLERQGASST